MKILVAEDNRTLQNSIEILMDHWGFQFDIAPDGQRAVELAKANEGEYDLCMMDVNMPILNGLEASKRIRRTTKYLPIVALTGYSMSRDEYLEADMDDYLRKPYAPHELYDKIRELTVKTISVHKERNHIVLKKEMPVDAEELRELRELDKKGLTKFSLIDTGYKFVVHKNIQNKISHDFIAKGKKLSEFLDRSTDDPGIIHLYESNLHANKRHILPELLEQLVQKEDKEMNEYTTKAEYPENSVS